MYRRSYLWSPVIVKICFIKQLFRKKNNIRLDKTSFGTSVAQTFDIRRRIYSDKMCMLKECSAFAWLGVKR